MIFSSVVALLWATVLADNLYPKCIGEELDKRITTMQGDVKLTNIEGTGTKLLGDCIAFEVTSVQEGSCNVPHQTELPYRIFMRAVGVSDPTYIVDFDIDDVLGGSVNALTFSTSKPSTFSVFVRNLHPSPNCLMRVRAIVSTSLIPESEIDRTYAAPSLVNIKPATVFAHHVNSTAMVFRMEDPPQSSDEVFLLPQNDDCAHPSGTPIVLSRVIDPAVVTPLVAEYSNPAAHTVWRHHFDLGGTFNVCYHRDGHKAEHVALLSVFAGNPRYFDVVKGGGPRGEIYLFTEIVLRFFGTDLDTRPSGDQAKLVIDTDTCRDGVAAGGVPLTTDLGPADDWGPLTTHTDWTLIITMGGAYKVCYKRSTGPWTEVPFITDVPAAAKIKESTTAAPLVVPTDPVNKQPCEIAPTRTVAAPPSSLLRFTLRASAVPSYFASLLSQILCVSKESVVVFRQSTNAQGHAVVLCDIRCGSTECSSDERKYFVTYTFENSPDKFNALFKDLPLLYAEEVPSDGLNIVDGPPSSAPRERKPAVPIFICLTIIVVVAIVVYGVVVARRQEHRFIQFGIDDDDDAPELSDHAQERPVVRGIVSDTAAV